MTDDQTLRQSTVQPEPTVAPEGGSAGVSLDAGELARVNEALLANAIWVKSLHSQLLAKTEALAERDVELARANLALDVQAETLARMGRELDELRAIYTSTSWRLIRVLRGVTRAASSPLRRLWASLTLKRPSSPPVEKGPQHDRNTRNLFELTPGARLFYAQVKAALARRSQRR